MQATFGRLGVLKLKLTILVLPHIVAPPPNAHIRAMKLAHERCCVSELWRNTVTINGDLVAIWSSTKMAVSHDISPIDIEAQNDGPSGFNHEAAVNRIRSASVVTISPELFEKASVF